MIALPVWPINPKLLESKLAIVACPLRDPSLPTWMREEMKGTKLTKDSFLIK
jgi:hypothetical protein